MKTYCGALQAFRVACVVVSTSAVTMSCGGTAEPEKLEAAQSHLLDGTPTLARPEVVRFVQPAGWCTATMISSRTFLTASHCIDNAPMLLGGNIVVGEGWTPSMQVDRTFSLRYDDDDNGTDLAVGRTTGDVPGITPATLATDEPGVGFLTKVGYGCTQNRGVGCSPSGRTFISYFYDGGDSAVTAQGDSGGPTFIGQLNDGGAIVRVNSAYHNDVTSWPLGPVIIRGTDVFADTVVHRTDIETMSDALNNDFGLSSRSQVNTVGYLPAFHSPMGRGIILGDGDHGIEAIQLWSPSLGVPVCYQVHVQNIGWQTEVCDGPRSGIPGNSIDAVRIRMQWPSSTTIEYRVFRDDNVGWEPFQVNGDVAGTVDGPAIRMLWVTLLGL